MIRKSIIKNIFQNGIGNETTLSVDLNNYDELCKYLLKLTEETMYRLRKENMSATCVSVKIKTKDFKNYSHQRKVTATDSTKTVYKVAKELLEEVLQNNFVRLIGVRVDGLVNNNEIQLNIFDTVFSNEKQKKLDKTVDSINEKFGYGIISRASNLKKL
ncbi:MAG: hypothetical protein LBL91_04565 [Lachnospiraceae bacterium]|jgi:DNA polymerase-4|nr:hypothetical protein [Lachnospiraceae bacterium]